MKKSNKIEGLIKKIIYRNPENGFTVLTVSIKDITDSITIVGDIVNAHVGHGISATGSWEINSKYGNRFIVKSYDITIPANPDSIEKYLSSGEIKGIGPTFAKKIVKFFGASTLDIIENNPERLYEVGGIGEKKIESIKNAIIEQKSIRDIIMFLGKHGINTFLAHRIFKQYGEESIKIILNNPYQLSYDIKGIGFTSADRIAVNLGMPINSIMRVKAALHHVLSESASSGHTCLHTSFLLKETSALINIYQEDLLNKALEEEIIEGHLKRGEVEGQIGNYKKDKGENDKGDKQENYQEANRNDNQGDKEDDNQSDNQDEERYNNQDDKESDKEEIISSTKYFFCEKNISEKIKKISNSSKKWEDDLYNKRISDITTKLQITLSDDQKEAIKIALTSKISVITGGPGTGKTTIINTIIKILEPEKVRIKLCAPTGRAAKRLSESTNQSSYTIHRLLKYDPSTYKFKYNQNNQLQCDLIIIDESSMIDVMLMNHLIKSLPDICSIVIVGDIDQLPSIGAGQLLKDIIDSGIIPVSRLHKIYRQSEGSDIVTNAHLVNKGIIPRFDLSEDRKSETRGTEDREGEDGGSKNEDSKDESSKSRKNTDFFFSESKSAEHAVEKIKTLISTRIKEKFGFDPINDIQILSPTQKGMCGIRELNTEIQKVLNPSFSNGLEKGGYYYSRGDKVMQIENNYDKDVYNGDIGYIKAVNLDERELLVDFDGRNVRYTFSEIDELVLAYAITIHKSQGSEYPVVIIPIMTEHFYMLKRNLLYTAITRGKKLVVLVGQKKAFNIAIKNNKNEERKTLLKQFLLGKYKEKYNKE